MAADLDKLQRQARTISDRDVVERQVVAEAKCQEFTAAANKERNSWWVADDKLAELERVADDWCAIRTIYTAEFTRRRAENPAITATSNEVRQEFKAHRGKVAERVASAEEQARWYSPFVGLVEGAGEGAEAVTGAATDAAASYFGLGADQTAGERAAGIGRLLVAGTAAVIALYLLFRVGRFGVRQAAGQLRRTQQITDRAVRAQLGMR